MPRIRHTLRFPAYRNLQIYHGLAYERRTQTAVAKQLGLSQRRVSQIAQQVRAWVDTLIEPSLHFGKEGLRFHLAIAVERCRLCDQYDPLVQMFAGPDGFPRFIRTHLSVVKGHPQTTVEVTSRPNIRLLNQALDVSIREAELAAIAARGPFPHLPQQHRQTISDVANGDKLEAEFKTASNPVATAAKPSDTTQNNAAALLTSFTPAP